MHSLDLRTHNFDLKLMKYCNWFSLLADLNDSDMVGRQPGDEGAPLDAGGLLILTQDVVVPNSHFVQLSAPPGSRLSLKLSCVVHDV